MPPGTGPTPTSVLCAPSWRAWPLISISRGPTPGTTPRFTGALRGWHVRDRLHGIDVPTLVIRGRYDMCTEPIASTLVNGIRGAREVVLEHSSHTPALEETDRYLEVVGSFLAEAEANA